MSWGLAATECTLFMKSVVNQGYLEKRHFVAPALVSEGKKRIEVDIE